MIPVFRPKERYLRKAIESVLCQQNDPGRFQVQVVDDCSPDCDVQALVQSIAGDTVAYYRTSRNLGLAGAWNTCIERARGEWVHILHQDDYVLPGFYNKLEETIGAHPDVALVATRSFFVDEEDVIVGVTRRVKELEHGSRAVEHFFYGTPLQCPAVAVCRRAYETHGGFVEELRYLLDVEMWARLVGAAGGLLTSEVLACYRRHGDSETAYLLRTGITFQDYERLHQLFAHRYREFDARKAASLRCSLAWSRGVTYKEKGQMSAAKACFDYWRKNAPLKERFFKQASAMLRGRQGHV